MGKQWALLYALVFMLPGQAKAQSDKTLPPMSLEHQEAIENLDKLLGALEDLESSVDRGTAAKKTQCMKAIGNMEFCECIGENSPVGVTFMGYVSIAAGTKEGFKYNELSADDKELFDATRAARDKCVSWKGKADQLKPASQGD